MKKVCVVTNMLEGIKEVQLPFNIKKVLLSNYDKEYTSNKLTLSPFEKTQRCRDSRPDILRFLSRA